MSQIARAEGLRDSIVSPYFQIICRGGPNIVSNFRVMMKSLKRRKKVGFGIPKSGEDETTVKVKLFLDEHHIFSKGDQSSRYRLDK